MVVLFNRKFSERVVSVVAKLDAPLFAGEHIGHQVRNLRIVLDMQNRDRRGAPHRTQLRRGPASLSRLRENMASALSDPRSRLEQFLMPDVYYRNQALVMFEAEQMRSFRH